MKKKLINILKYKKKGLCIGGLLVLFLVVLSIFISGVNNYDKTYAQEPPLTLMDQNSPNSYDNPYLIKGVKDMYILQEFTKYNTCEGMFFRVSPELKDAPIEDMLYYVENEDVEDEEGVEGEGLPYHVDLIDNLDPKSYGIQQTDEVWYGIGMNYSYPFKGNIDFQGITLRTNTSIFGFLGDNAIVRGLRVFGNITNEKNNEYYGVTSAPIGGIASVAYIKDPDGNNNSITVTNCYVTNATITGNLSSENGSVGGIIGLCYGDNDTSYGKTQAGAVNFIIETCVVNADIKCKGYYSYRNVHSRLGHGSKNGVDSNGTLNPNNITNANIGSNYSGYVGGLIGEVMTYNGSCYANVNIKGDNQVYGNINASNSVSGGAIGSIYTKVHAKFTGSLSLKNTNEKLHSLTNLSAPKTENCYSGLLVGNTGYSLITVEKDVNGSDFVFVNNEEDLVGIPMNGNSGFIGTPANVYNYPDLSATKLEGLGTDESPYKLKSKEDFVRLSIWLSTGGNYGREYFDFSARGDNSEINHTRMATYELSNDVDISGTGINTMNRHTNYSFAGKIIGKMTDDGKKPVLTFNIDTYQDDTCLFNYVYLPTGKQVVFKDFDMTGDIKGRGRVGGLIYRIESNRNGYTGDFLMENIDNTVNLSAHYDIGGGAYNSPFIGYFYARYEYQDYNNENGVMTQYVPKFQFKNLSWSGDAKVYNGRFGALMSCIETSQNKYGYKTIIDIDDFEMTGDITCVATGVNNNLIGGLIGTVYSNCTESMNFFANTETGQTFNFGNTGFVSEYSEINLSNIKFDGVKMKVNKNLNLSFGGLLAYSSSGVNFNVTDLSVKDCNTEFYNGSHGGLMYSISSCQSNFKNINYDNFQIYQRTLGGGTYIGGLFGYNNGGSCLVNVENYNINDCVVIGNRRFSDFYGINYGNSGGADHYYEWCAKINLIGKDENGKGYSVTNPYTHKFSYKSSLNGTLYEDYKGFEVQSRLFYNVFTSDNFSAKGSSNKEDYMIHGTGEKNDPFIIDSPEKMMVMQMISLEAYGARGMYIDYFADINLERYSSTTISKQRWNFVRKLYTGYYLFTDDINLKDYSFCAIAANGGKYYGFNANKYLNDNGITITDDALADIYADAIDVLSRDEEIIDKYEKSFAEEYNAFLIEKGIGYDFLATDKLIIANRVEANHADVYNEYIKLKEYLKYKPVFNFDAASIDNSDKVNAGYLYLTSDGIAKEADRYSSYAQARYSHMSLFTNINYCRGQRAVEINNISLKGTFSGTPMNNDKNNGGSGGALIGRNSLPSIVGSDVDIRNIDFGDTVIEYNGWTDKTYGTGLMIDSISSSEVNMYGITVLPGSTIQADALIGYQSSDTALTVFEHIDLNEAIDQLRYGIFFYNYDEGLSIYWYDDGDYEATEINTDIITPGLVNVEGEKRVVDLESINNETYTYAYKRNKVEINPKTHHIIHGNGTKEDPFVISNVAQLTSLQLAFKGLGQIAGKDEWFVGEIKNNPDFDPEDSTTWELNGAHNYVTWEQTDTEANRKNRLEYIRSAYYVITEDINLHDIPEEFEDFAIAANGYLGLGTDTFPFSGSFDGSYSYDEATNTLKKKDVNSTITLNTYSGDKAYQYGLVKYANGVNISNLNITSPKDDEGNYLPVNLANTNARYGMAIAVITGGDNVIDNVNVSGSVNLVTAPNNNNLNGNTTAGGFVGYVMAGTVTFTNIDKDAVKDFKAYGYREDNDYRFLTNIAGGYVGQVYGSAVAFIDNDVLDENVNTYETLPESIYTSDAEYTTVRSGKGYFVNKKFIEEVLADKIKVTGTAADGFDCFIDNEKHMYILSLAVKCGALSANTTYRQNLDDANYFPYGYYAKTYKTNGDNNVKSYNAAIFEYFDFSEVTPSYDSSGRVYTFEESGIGATMFLADRAHDNDNGYTMLNQIASATINHENGEFRTTYTLKEDGYYDMTKIPDFNGFGPREALSNQATRLAHTLSSDFDGRGSEVHYEFAQLGNKAGLFNGYTDSEVIQSDKKYAINFRNMILTGSIDIGNNGTTYAGALIGYAYTKQYITVSNVTVKDFVITGKTGNVNMGALIGANTYNYGQWNLSYINDVFTLENVVIGDEINADSPEVDGKKYSVVLNGTSNNTYIGAVYGYTVQSNLKDIEVKNIYMKGVQTTHIGGLIGHYDMYGRFHYLENVSVKDSYIQTESGCAGGLIGNLVKSQAQQTPSLSGMNLLVENTHIESKNAQTNANAFEGQLIGRQGGTMETGFVDIHTEFADDFTGHVPEKVWNRSASGEKKSEYFYINQLTDIEAVEEKYGLEGVSQSDATLRDTNIRYGDLIATQTLVDSGEKSFIFTDEDGNPLDLIPDNGRDDDYLLVEWVTDAGTLEQVLNSLLDTLTNGTGMLNNPHEDASGDPNENIEIEIIPMQVSHGVVSVGTHTPSVTITKDAAGRFVITNNNLYDRVEKTNSKGEYTPGSYSLINIRYNVSLEATKNNVGYTKTISIPFMVSNMINVDLYYRVELGENFDEDYLHKSTDRSLTLTKDSSYTVYNEILYSNNRQLFVDEEVYYVKEFVLDPKKPVIPKGTKLTLIDATDGISKTYYYVVKDYKTSVRLTEFADEDGNHYKERDISDAMQIKVNNTYRAMAVSNKSTVKKKYGVEKFIVFVDNTQLDAVDNITGEESVWKPGIVNASGFLQDDLDDIIGGDTEKIVLTEEVFYEKNRCSTTLNTYNGRNIGFVDDSLITSGTINKESNLRIDVSFFNEASTTYWDYINNKYTMELNDYANNEKYLEVAFTLINEDGERILFPQGTKVKYQVTNQIDGIRSTSHVYYYKDSGTDGYLLMELTENTIEDVSIEFDFSSAKMENLPAGNYSIELQLLRTGNKDFPMGSEVLDVLTTGAITVTESVEYGFSISGYNKADLSYNKTQEFDEFVLDYNVNINSNFKPEVTGTKKVGIVYKLLMKNEQTGVYEEYVPIDNEYPSIIIKDMSSTGYQIIKNGNQVSSGNKGVVDISNTYETVDGNEQVIYITDIPGEGEDILTIPFKLTMPTNAKAVNYKIVATLYSDDGKVKESEDIVIFNISDIDV